VIYIGHLPALFGEQELSIFLKQFGKVLNVRVSRSKKTGGSRGYAFCQFQDPDVANIVAETLSGYLLFDAKQHVRKRLVCHVVPNDKVHPKLFYGRYMKKIITKPAKTSTSSRSLPVITARLVKRERKKRKALEAAGIEYDFPGYEAGVKKLDIPTTSSSLSDQKVVKKHKSNPPSNTTNDESATGKKAEKKKRKDSVTSMEEIETSGNANSRKDKTTDIAEKKKDATNTHKKQQQSPSSKTEKQKSNENSNHLVDDTPSSSSKTRAESLGSEDEKAYKKNRDKSSTKNLRTEKEKTPGLLPKESKGDHDTTSKAKKRRDSKESKLSTTPGNEKSQSDQKASTNVGNESLVHTEGKKRKDSTSYPKNTTPEKPIDNNKHRNDSMDSGDQGKDTTARVVQSDAKKKKKKKKNKNRQSV
jgi:nucleolar protein 15